MVRRNRVSEVPKVEGSEMHGSNDEERTTEQLLEEVAALRQEKARLQRLCDEWSALDRRREDALQRVSHELKTPVAAIRAYAEILLEYPPEDPDKEKQFLSIIRGESRRLGKMIDDLLDLSKIRQGKTEWRFERIGVRPLVERAAKAAESLVSEKGLVLETRVEELLPSLTADEDRIHRVLNNILANAIEFTPPGGTISIRAEFLEEERGNGLPGFIHLSVGDTGKGIAPEELPSVFDRFSQSSDGRRGRAKSLGLGLCICKEIVLEHRGSIWAESTPGKGSTFHVALPVEPPGPGSCGKAFPGRAVFGPAHPAN